MRHTRSFFMSTLIGLLLTGTLSIGMPGDGEAQEQKAPEPAPELVIVKYGKVSVKSSVPGAKVYVDGAFVGTADNFNEDIAVGKHAISCRTEDKAVSGSFVVKKDAPLRLEARFNEGKLIDASEAETAMEKRKQEQKAHTEAAKQQEEKKRTAAVEAKRPEPKREQKSPAEELREQNLTLIKVGFDDADPEKARVSHKVNPKIIGNYAERQGQTGKYYRTKQHQLLCDVGPCEKNWSSSFVYTDETGKSDTMTLTWKQVVFNGITPTGTSKRTLIWCVGGACDQLEDASPTDDTPTSAIGRYRLSWTKASLSIMRADIMKQFTDAGRPLPE